MRAAALLFSLILLVSTAVGAYAASEGGLPQRKNEGTVYGIVLDGQTGRPLQGAEVRLKESAGFLEPVKTDAQGRFQVSARIGNRHSTTKFRLAGLISGPLMKTRSSRSVDLVRAAVSVELKGYRPFYGVVETGLASPSKFAVYLKPVMLSPENSQTPSHASDDDRWEEFEHPELTPVLVRPGGKVNIVLRMRTLFPDAANYEAYATNPDGIFGKEAPKLSKKKISLGSCEEIVFFADLTTTKKPSDVNALIKVLVFRDGESITPTDLKPMLLQFTIVDEKGRLYPSMGLDLDSAAAAAEAHKHEQAAQLCAKAWRFSENGEISKAIENAKKAAELAPNYPCAVELIGRFSMTANRIEDGVAYLRRLSEMRSKDLNGTVANYIDALITAGKYDEAEAALAEALARINKEKDEKDKAYQRLHAVAARLALAKGDITTAEERVKKSGVLPPAFVHRMALERARISVKNAPEDASARYSLGKALADTGDWVQAVNEFREAIRLGKSADPWLRLDLAAAYVKGLNRPDLALPELEEAVRLMPDNAEAALAIAECHRMMESYEEAAANYAKAASAHPANFYARHWNGIFKLINGNQGEAIAELAEAVKLGREKGTHNVRAGYYYYFTDESVTSYQSGFDRPEAEWDYIILDSLSVLTEQPNDPISKFMLGLALVELGVPRYGITHLEAVAEPLAGNIDLKRALALAKWRLGNTSEALAAYEEIINLKPHNYRARKEMAALAAELGDDFRAASLLLEVGKRLTPWSCVQAGAELKAAAQ